jgi:hypothetical protein
MRVAESTMTSSATVSTKARRSLTIGANASFAKVKGATWEQFAKHATVLDGFLCPAALGIEKIPDLHPVARPPSFMQAQRSS